MDLVLASISDVALLGRYMAEIRRAIAADCPTTITFDPLSAVAVACHVQLALRHSDNLGPSAAMARFFVGQIAAAFADYPAIGDVIERGWHE